MTFVFNDTASTEIYTLSLHDALPICPLPPQRRPPRPPRRPRRRAGRRRPHDHPLSGTPRRAAVERGAADGGKAARSEEHTSELQSRQYLVCRPLFEKKHSVCPTIRCL